MALSEQEEQTLAEMARHLAAEDPRFVAAVTRTTTPARLQLRRLGAALAGLTAGAILFLLVTFHLALGVAGFAVMLLSLAAAVRAVRSLAPVATSAVHSRRRTPAQRDGVA